jgi:hypothetical protein
MINTAKNVLILLLILVVGFFILSPNDVRDNTPSVVSRIDTFYKHDTLRKYKKGDSIPFAVLDTLYLIDSIKIHDTPQMIYDYLSVKAYSDTLRINTDNSVYIQDTITQNKIIGRSYKANLIEKTILVTNDVYHKPKNELFVGLIGDIRRFDNKIGIGVGVVYKKQREAYIINYSTNQISLGLYKKLF